MMMAFQAAMSANGAHPVCQRVIVGKESASISVTAERLRRKEARAADQSHTTTALPVLLCAEALRAIFNHFDAMFRGQRVNPVVVRHLAEQAHWHDGLCFRCDRLLDLI